MYDIEILGDRLYITNQFFGMVGLYDVTTGTAIDPSFISGLSEPTSLVFSVPEPAGAALLLLGGLGLLARRRRG